MTEVVAGNGDPSVTMGSYLQVLRVLGLTEDLALVAKEDVLGRQLQDEALPRRKRTPRKKIPEDDSPTFHTPIRDDATIFFGFKEAGV